MKLEKEIISLIPREESGSKTARKYIFQKNLSLYLLLSNHEKKDDYVFLFDFHDDLVVLDSSTNPDKIDFYQIKSKDFGNWTNTALTKKTKKEPLSISGKLYLNKINFSNNTNSLNFVSNAKFSFKNLANGTESLKKTIIKADELDPKVLKVFEDAIKNEHSLKTIDFKDITHFHVTNLSNIDSSTHCLGELSKLINKINPENKVNPELAYKQVFNEISRRTESTVTDKSISNLEELIEIKGISKKQFLAFLKKAGLYKSIDEEWLEIKYSIERCNIGHIELLKFKKAWRDLSATLIKDSNNILLNNLYQDIETIISTEIENGNIKDSFDLIEIVNHCECKIENTFYDKYFIKCLIIKVLNEK
ncbi:dsDNA nuclease domain-containing protein [Ochrovirga pacifica]|uniref:dsDNA nuclease domain-containing protein n=1 Tax=Ochrovirga pacifica TaxID=1042376 RepID=UPI0002558E73|nr:dsDNA nuclease domain-containing protein [Ochrovirga pacifica]